MGVSNLLHIVRAPFAENRSSASDSHHLDHERWGWTMEVIAAVGNVSLNVLLAEASF